MGTSLEVLAPYLPFGIELAHVEYPNEDLNYQLKSLSVWPEYQIAIGHPASSAFEWIEAKHVLPVLRPFSQLVEPLPDGTIPAELLFEMAFEHNYTAGLPIGVPNPAYAECEFTAQIMAGGMLSAKRFGFGDCELRIYPDWQFARKVDGILRWAHHPSAIVDKLRSWHFALPVNGRPLVEGVDYIAKSAPATPTKQEESV